MSSTFVFYCLRFTFTLCNFMSLFIRAAILIEISIDPQGLIPEVFTTILRGLSGAKVTRPGKFRSCQDGYAVKSSLKAEDGVLYPLEKGFFFLPKPPTLILHDEVPFPSTNLLCELSLFSNSACMCWMHSFDEN